MKKLGLVLVAALVTACSANEGPSVNRPLYLPNSADGARTGAAATPSKPPEITLSRESVTYQANPQHTGYVSAKLRLPLTRLWSVNLGYYNGAVGYPVVANGIVVVAANGKLVALDAKTGKTRWSHKAFTKTRGGAWVGAAYDNGTIFSDPTDTSFGKLKSGMYAFDEGSGKELWSAAAPREWSFSSPPTAVSGTVYTNASGDGGVIYAYNESDGTLQWTASPPNASGADSSPAVTSKGLYVSYACPQAYDFNPSTGKQIWHYNGQCSGGGGSTPVYYDGLVFVEDNDISSQFNGLILTAKKGTVAGHFDSDFTPAFADYSGFFVTGYGSTLTAAKIPSMRQVWSATLSSDRYVTPPFIVGGTVYIETASGELLGYASRTGKQEVGMNLGNYGNYRGLSVGLGYGSHELIVPDGSTLIALKGAQQ